MLDVIFTALTRLQWDAAHRALKVAGHAQSGKT
jgi:hypothetical protein